MTQQEIYQQAHHVMQELEKNGMTAAYVATKEEVPAMVQALLRPGDTIGLGGSMTLQECGVLELVRRPEYRLIDRYQPGLDRAGMADCFDRAMTADVFLCSSNAVTENGELYNVDGTANRVAALLYGPKRVILVIGYQKIVADMAAAVERVRTVAAPKNAQRLHRETYCAAQGRCIACGKPMGAGCASPQRICRDFAVCAAQSVPGRIHVILVGEQTGY